MASQGPSSPGTTTDDSSIGTAAWTNPNNSQTSNDTYATFTGENSIADQSIRIVKGGTISGTDQTSGAGWPIDTDAYVTFGSSTNLWGMSWTDTDINATTFGVVISAHDDVKGAPDTVTHYLKATNFGFTIPSGATINGIVAEFERRQVAGGGGTQRADLDHVRMTVYYTELATTTSTSSTSSSLSTSTSTTTYTVSTSSTSSSISTSTSISTSSTSSSTSLSTSSTSSSLSTSSTSSSTSTVMAIERNPQVSVKSVVPQGFVRRGR